MSKVISLINLTASLKRVLSNNVSAGVDGMSVKELQSWFSNHHEELAGEPKNKNLPSKSNLRSKDTEAQRWVPTVENTYGKRSNGITIGTINFGETL